MKLYKIAERNIPEDASIEAAHCWSLPGVTCDLCAATWANTGLAYPQVDLSRLPDTDPYLDPWPVPVHRFQELRDEIIPLLPNGAIILPGTESGPFHGTFRGAPGPFVWLNPWTLLASSAAIRTLRSKGTGMPSAVRAKLRSEAGMAADLFEIAITPHGRLAPSCVAAGSGSFCERCGRRGITKPEVLMISRVSLHEGIKPQTHSSARSASAGTGCTVGFSPSRPSGVRIRVRLWSRSRPLLTGDQRQATSDPRYMTPDLKNIRIRLR